VRILIVEDNKGQQMVYQHWFEGETLDLCDSVDGARELIKKKKYDAVILDLYLKDKESGFRLLEEIAQSKLRPKIIIVSAYIDQLQEMFPVEMKGVTWIPKEEATRERLKEELERV